MSGFYTADFPDNPPSFFDFTDDFSSDLIYPTIQATKVRMLNYNEEVEVVFQGTNLIDASIEHPMHLHGCSFYAIGSGYGVFDNETDPKGYNFVDPPKLNTVTLPKNGWFAIGFKASNPGMYILVLFFLVWYNFLDDTC